MFTNCGKNKVKKNGQCGVFYIRVIKAGDARDFSPKSGAKCWDLWTDYNIIPEEDVRAHCEKLSECTYLQENMEDSAEWLNASIGPELHKRVHMNGVEDLPGPLLLYRILKVFSVSNRSKCISSRNKILGMSIKKCPELNYSKLSNDLLAEVHLIHHTDPDYLKGTEDVGIAVVKALTVEPGWVRANVDHITLQKPLLELEEKVELGEKMPYVYLESNLRKIDEVHKNLKETGAYKPASRKPKPEDQRAASLLAQVNNLKKEMEAMKGGNSSGGNNNSNSGGKKDKSKIQCHACKQFGHYKTDKVCPKYEETKKKSQNGGSGSGNNNNNNSGSNSGSGSGSNNSGNQAENNKWRLTKTTETIEKNGTTWYWCPKCNKGKGKYVTSHGPSHPSKQHDENYVHPGASNNGSGGNFLAVDSSNSADVGGISFGGVEFGAPIGFLGFIEDLPVHPKGSGHQTA
jgi:hypothetical protein